jgi:hypothetical protein
MVLLDLYKKHKAYLEMQIDRCKYLDSKDMDANHHLARAEAYELSLDNLKSLFGENK